MWFSVVCTLIDTNTSHHNDLLWNHNSLQTHRQSARWPFSKFVLRWISENRHKSRIFQRMENFENDCYCLFSNREGLGTSLEIMGLATIDPHSHKVQTKLYKIPKFGVNRPKSKEDTVIWKCQNLQRNVWPSRRCPTQCPDALH